MEITVSESKKEEKKSKKSLKKFLISFVLFILSFTISFGVTYYLDGGFNIQNAKFVKEYTTFKISIPKGLPSEIETELKTTLGSVGLEDIKRFEVSEGGDLALDWKEGSGAYTEYVIPVSHFYTVSDDFNPAKQKVYIDTNLPEGIKSLLQSKYPSAKVSTDVEKSLDEDGKNVVLIQPKNLSFKYKLMKVDGKYYLDSLDGSLKYSLSLKEENKFVENILNKAIENSKLGTYTDSLEKVMTLNQTGVTAMSRSLASKIEASGDYGYPAKKIAKFLKSSDLTHVSNEVSSAPGCVPVESLRFCAKAEYLKTFTDIGVDIVELTGNHNNDYGASNNLNTIKNYTKLGMKYFGGGKDEEDAAKILYMEVKDTKLAFIGYNYYDTMLGTGALAAKDRAGANSYSVKKMEKNIAEAKKNADIVIVDFQFQECYSYPPSDVIFPICYKPLTSPDQRGTFQKAIDLGADIVVGTQAHQPQTYELYKGKPIFYGLGNLFFDQTEWIGTRQGIILTHYFKEGKLIQTKINTTIYDAGMQTYLTKGAQRELLLNLLKDGRE